MATLPDPHAIFSLLVTVLALYAFTRDKVPLEASSLAVLVVLIVVFELFPYEPGGIRFPSSRFLEGFGNEALITICALLVVGKGLESTGALQPVAAWLARVWLKTPQAATLMTLIASAVLSAFVNNTPVVVMLLPMLIGVAARTKTPPSAVLMPVGFATLLGGMSTSIGTSTNLLVVQIASDLGVPRFEMFDFALPVVIVGALGMAYLWIIAPRILPTRKAPLSDTTPRVFDAVFHINEDSAACGKTFSQVLALTSNQMRVQRIERHVGHIEDELQNEPDVGSTEPNEPAENRIVGERRRRGPDADVEIAGREHLHLVAAIEQEKGDLPKRPLEHNECTTDRACDQQCPAETREHFRMILAAERLRGQAGRPHAQEAESPENE